MSRTVKDYAERRNEIITVAQRLVYTKGYEQMTIQDILDEIQISKGAFYHYFDSKQQLLEGLIEHFKEEADKLIYPIVEDASLSGMQKLQRLIDTLGRWKRAQKDYILALLRVWYADDNAIVRQKVQSSLVKQTTPIFTSIIQQGIREGEFHTPFPDQAGEIIMALMVGLGDTFMDVLIYSEPALDDLERLTVTVAAYSEAMERILGSSPGSILLMDTEIIKTWVNKQEKFIPQVVG